MSVSRTPAPSSSSGNSSNTPSRPLHRRPRSSSRVMQKVPIPLSVQIYNLFPGHYINLPEDDDDDDADDKIILRNTTTRLDYSTQLLRPVRAELVDVPRSNNKSDGGGSLKAETKLLYTFPLDYTTCCTISPCWTHLSDVLNWEELDRQSYDRIHIRFRLEPPPTTTNDDGGAELDKDNTGTYFLQVPLHPSKLIPLQRDLPPNRPINTALVHFSDETFRITPFVFEQLKHETLAVADEQLLRFEEDAFQALDNVVASTTSPGSLLDAAEEYEASSGGSGLTIHATSTEISVEVLPSPGSAEQQLLEEMRHLPPESSAEIAELQLERDALLERIQAEQDAVSVAKLAWQSDQAYVRETVKILLTKQEHIQKIQQATKEEELECQRLELHLEAQRIRLLKELQQIYPVSVQDGPPIVWRIRGLVLPRELFTVSEDDLSAALGFLCHVVALMSRYLSVPLRYRLYCNSSRSAVQDDRGTVSPLFQARPVEREQVEAGVILLERNVECIGLSWGINWETDGKSASHILEKVKMIYDIVIRGEQ